MAQSHWDGDSFGPLPEFTKLFQKAKELTERGENLITAGCPGEAPLEEWDLGTILVRRLPDDPLAVRVSIGSLNQAVGEYLVYRGERSRVKALLERSLAALDAVKDVKP